MKLNCLIKKNYTNTKSQLLTQKELTELFEQLAGVFKHTQIWKSDLRKSITIKFFTALIESVLLVDIKKVGSMSNTLAPNRCS